MLFPRALAWVARPTQIPKLTDCPPTRYSIFIGLFVILAMCAAAWFLSPKGENRVYVSSLFFPISAGLGLFLPTC